MTGVVVLVVTVLAAAAVGLVQRARAGRVRASSASTQPALVADELEALGVVRGERATLVQFSSAFCAPCRATRSLLADVAETVPGVRHAELDVAAGERVLDLVRTLDIRRTPTTLVLDGQGREIRRASGVPRREQLLTALASAVA